MTELVPYQMLIDGDWCDATDGKSFASFNPASGQPWAHIPEASEGDVDRAVQAGARALSDGPWSQATPTERGRYLYALSELLAQHSEHLGKIETMDTGKLFKETKWQAKYISEFFRYYAGLADKIHGHTLPIDKRDMCVFTMREPLGVVAAVVPWNSQLFLSAVKLAPALAAGNTVVLKASEHAAAAMLEFGKLISEAGLPRGVVNIITGYGEPCGRALASHPQVARVSFTGGLEAARHVVRASAENFAQVSLELGGKSPLIVFEDADIESAVNGAIAGIFGASGQSCVAASRLYVQENIADAFLAKMKEQAARIVIGEPLQEDTQMGPLATTAQLERIEEEVALAVEQGATLMHGGRRPSQCKQGWYFEPTILACPRQDMCIVDTELFGPVLSVLRFQNEEEAIQLANKTQYGLAAGIFTRDGARALRVARAVRAGIVWVNTYRVISPIAEFGGYKNSGSGRESGMQAIYDYTRPKTIWINTSPQPFADPFVMR